MTVLEAPIRSSFRDPSGHVFSQNGRLYRQINSEYQAQYKHLMSSGLYKELVNKSWLVAHKECEGVPLPSGAFAMIEPEFIPFISYGYEWSFGQLKAAALRTLDIQLTALKYGMTLKDASSYNIQYNSHNPVFIDTLSFDFHNEGSPWIAYRQFCQHFLAPLALMSKVDIRLNSLLRTYLDGIPLDLASKLLKGNTGFSLGILSHIHMHAKAQKKYETSDKIETSTRKLPKNGLESLLMNLRATVETLTWMPQNTQWAEYYDFTNYSEAGLDDKKQIISDFIDRVKPGLVWDLGGNTGYFSRVAADKGIKTYSFDIDPAAVEKNFLLTCSKKETNCLPLLMDLSNPTPSNGWAHEEWKSLEARGPADLCMALAIIHHLALSNHMPMERIAEYFSRLGKQLIIEFVPPEDSQVEKITRTNKVHLARYNLANFESAFGQYFNVLDSKKVTESGRILFLLERK